MINKFPVKFSSKTKCRVCGNNLNEKEIALESSICKTCIKGIVKAMTDLTNDFHESINKGKK